MSIAPNKGPDYSLEMAEQGMPTQYVANLNLGEFNGSNQLSAQQFQLESIDHFTTCNEGIA